MAIILEKKYIFLGLFVIFFLFLNYFYFTYYHHTNTPDYPQKPQKHNNNTYIFCAFEKSSEDLVCPDNNYIHILSAVWTTAAVKEDECTDQQQCEKPLLSQDATRIIRIYCNGKNTCLVKATPEFLGWDSCPSKYKAIKIRYQCIRESIQVPIPKVKVGMLFFEGRVLAGINPSIESVLNNVPSNWGPLYFIHAPESKNPEQVKEIKKLSFLNLAKQKNIQVIFKPMKEENYLNSQNLFALDIEFWKPFTEDFIFLFHYDSAMCGPKNRIYPFEFYTHFDYVGAPWEPTRNYKDTPIYTGNGGFSLRNVSLMRYCLEKTDKGDLKNVNEDYFYAYCSIIYGHPAPKELSRYFAVETTDTDNAWGVHSICNYARTFGCSRRWMKNWLEKCPESSFLFTKTGLCPGCPPSIRIE